MKAIRYLGVSFLNGKIQFAEIEHARKVTVMQLTECETAIDVAGSGAALSAHSPEIRLLAAEIRTVIKRQKFSSEYISFALPPGSVFINIIPIDTTLEGASFKKMLQWEVEQYLPGSNMKDFVIDSHGLPALQGPSQQTFMVAVRRPMAMFFQKVSAELKMKMNIIDIDHFSTEKTLLVNYPEILEYDIALFGMRKGSLDASLIHNGEMTDYRSFHLNDDALPTKSILDYLRYLKQRENSVPAALLLHGADISQNYIRLLRNETGIQQTLSMNAVRKLNAVEKIRQTLGKNNYQYSAAIGLALRTA